MSDAESFHYKRCKLNFLFKFDYFKSSGDGLNRKSS